MTTDPTWLPSTIMQTIGALFGIFMAVFVLVIQEYSKHKYKFRKDKETYQSYLNFIHFF